MKGPHNAYWYPTVEPPILRPVHHHQRVDLFDNGFGERGFVLYKFLYIYKSVAMPHRLQMVFQRLAVNSETRQNQSRLPKRQRIALDRVGIIGVLHQKLITQPLQLSRGQRTPPLRLASHGVYTGEKLLPAAVLRLITKAAPIRRFKRLRRYQIITPVTYNPRNSILRAQNPDTAVGYSPAIRHLFYTDIGHYTSPPLPAILPFQYTSLSE